MKITAHLLLLSSFFAFACLGCDKVQSDSKLESADIISASTVNNSANAKTSAQDSNSKVVNGQTRKNEADSPEKTVQAFYVALKKKDRPESLKFAGSDIVERLLKERKAKFNWTFSRCEEPKIKEYGDAVCFYDFKNGGIGLFLKNSGEQYRIVSTYYYDEN